MRYTAEKELAKAELTTTQFHLFADLILSFISIDADELWRDIVDFCNCPNFSGEAVSRVDFKVHFPKLLKHMSFEWGFAKNMYEIGNGYNMINSLFHTLISYDMEENFNCMLQNISNTGLSTYSGFNMYNIMKIILENGSCEKIFKSIQMRVSEKAIFGCFKKTTKSMSLKLLNIFISHNPQYGYFLGEPEFDTVCYYIGLRSKVYYLP
jgi:hypothetical protein